MKHPTIQLSNPQLIQLTSQRHAFLLSHQERLRQLLQAAGAHKPESPQSTPACEDDLEFIFNQTFK